MKLRKAVSVLLGVVLLLSLSACASDAAAVFVQSVAELSDIGGIAPGDRFAGIVVSENVAEVQRDSDKTIGELFVREGDDVTEGQALFTYDTDQLQLTLDKERLELEQLEATIENYKSQIEELEKERNKASEANKLQYTVQIQSTQIDLKEAELSLTAKQKAVEQSEAILENATVTSPVTGRIQSIDDGSSDNYNYNYGSSSGAYITIRQAGSYRVKGTIGELQRGGIMEGTRVKLISRSDENVFWTGTVTLVDYENPTQGNGNGYYDSGDEMTSSSKYPFYVELDDTKDLILGQHLYIEPETQEQTLSGLFISSAFVSYDEDGNAFVWAEHRGKLEKRSVTLGDYNDMDDTISILEGLTEEDYIAFPDESVCTEGAPVTREQPQEDAEEVA